MRNIDRLRTWAARRNGLLVIERSGREGDDVWTLTAKAEADTQYVMHERGTNSRDPLAGAAYITCRHGVTPSAPFPRFARGRRSGVPLRGCDTRSRR